MLSKVSSTPVVINKYYYEDSINKYYSDSWYYTLKTITVLENCTLVNYLNITSSWMLFITKTESATSWIQDNNWNTMSATNSSNYRGNLTLSAGETIYVRLLVNSPTTIILNASVRQVLATLYKTPIHKSLPRELKAIWEKATSTLYGYHIDNTRYTGE